MAKDYSRAFYASSKWRKAQTAYMTSQHYTCERCGEIARIVHHKKYITPANINDPEVTLNWDNLEALCQDCHNKEHTQLAVTAKGLKFDKNGNLIKR